MGQCDVRAPLCFGHSLWKLGPSPFLSLPLTFPLIRFPFTAGWTVRVFQLLIRARLEPGNFCTAAECSLSSKTILEKKKKLGPLAQSDSPRWCVGGHGFDPRVRRNNLSWRISHEILSTAILSLLLSQVGQLSVTGERMCTKYCLTNNYIQACSGKV